MINIIAHRGYWLLESEKNTITAFKRAFEHGYGIETDFRDAHGRLVISHDLPCSGVIESEEFALLCRLYKDKGTMALNIKADGLQALIKTFIYKAKISNHFVFDMSVPDTRGYLALGIPVFTRMSEYEAVPVFVEQAKGVWLDCFEGNWYGSALIAELLARAQKVALVSP